MRSLYNKVRAVEKLYKELSKSGAAFKEKAGYDCIKGCSACCQKADIEATILEFLPLAYYAFRDGRADELYNKFKNSDDSSICGNYNPFLTEINGGACSEYVHRGMICRLFAFSAITNKAGLKQLVACKTIKTEFALSYEIAQKNINISLKVPMMNEYYMRLYNIDPSLATKYYPINEAILRSLEYVMMYYSFRRKRA